MLVFECVQNLSALHDEAYKHLYCGVSRALDYMHTTFSPAAVALLDEELTAHLCDCGLASLRPLTRNTGKGKASEIAVDKQIEHETDNIQGDVYALLLELLTGRRFFRALFLFLALLTLSVPRSAASSVTMAASEWLHLIALVVVLVLIFRVVAYRSQVQAPTANDCKWVLSFSYAPTFNTSYTGFVLHGCWPRKRRRSLWSGCGVGGHRPYTIRPRGAVKTEFQIYWPNLTPSQQSHTHDTFLKRQWERHGKYGNLDCGTYFSKVLMKGKDIISRLNKVYSTLQAAKGDKIQVEVLRSALVTEFNVVPKVKVDSENGSLSEVKFKFASDMETSISYPLDSPVISSFGYDLSETSSG